VELVDLPPGDARWTTALPVLQELRPHLDRDALEAVLAGGAAQGLRFTAAYDGPACLGVAGWRVMDTTSARRKVYVDDLVTASAARSTGVGAALLREVERRAVEAGCTTLELDSGVQRHDAHRFYLRERFAITSHHFGKPLSGP
jgi:GNAT superfamily N-acetyltransferase